MKKKNPTVARTDEVSVFRSLSPRTKNALAASVPTGLVGDLLDLSLQKVIIKRGGPLTVYEIVLSLLEAGFTEEDAHILTVRSFVEMHRYQSMSTLYMFVRQKDSSNGVPEVFRRWFDRMVAGLATLPPEERPKIQTTIVPFFPS